MDNLRTSLLNLRLDFIHRFRNSLFDFYGVQIQVPKSVKKTIRRRLLEEGMYETEEVEFVKKHIHPGMDVIELGGSIGAVSSLIGQQLGVGDKHIIVEAVPELAELCEVNGRAGGGEHKVEVVCRAISYSGEEHIQFLKTNHAHIGRIAQHGEEHFTALTVKLRDLAATLDADRPLCLVCDIEGAEYKMFAQDLAVLKAAQVIIIEFHEQDETGEGIEVTEFLDGLATIGLAVVEHRNNVAVIRSEGMVP